MGLTKWEGYNIAREDIFRFTHSDAAPWTVVRANDKRRTTLNAMRFVLTRIDYTGKDFSVASATRPKTTTLITPPRGKVCRPSWPGRPREADVTLAHEG